MLIKAVSAVLPKSDQGKLTPIGFPWRLRRCVAFYCHLAKFNKVFDSQRVVMVLPISWLFRCEQSGSAYVLTYLFVTSTYLQTAAARGRYPAWRSARGPALRRRRPELQTPPLTARGTHNTIYSTYIQARSQGGGALGRAPTPGTEKARVPSSQGQEEGTLVSLEWLFNIIQA